MSTDYFACTKQVFESTNQIIEKRSEWMGRILFLSATLFGILISLHSNTQTNPGTRLCFAVACILLALGILLLSIASYHHIAAQSHARNKYAEEIQSAIDENRAVHGVRADKLRFFSICEIGAYICLLLSILALAMYSLLDSLIGL